MKKQLLWVSIVCATLMISLAYILKDTVYGTYVPFVIIFCYAFVYSYLMGKHRKKSCC